MNVESRTKVIEEQAVPRNKMKEDLIQHYDRLAPLRDHYRAKNPYYYSLVYKYYRYFIPENKKVLEVGCGTGELLHSLKSSWGVGVDISPEMIKVARKKYPHLTFFAGEITDLKLEAKFDYIVLPGILGEAEDIQSLLEALKAFCYPQTRIIIEYYSYLWQYVLKMGERLGLKIPTKIQNWITAQDLMNFLHLAGFEPIKLERFTLFPKYIWGFSSWINQYVARLPVMNALTLNHFFIARPLMEQKQEWNVSIVIPCRNEKGNIEPVLRRTPIFGQSQEFIFVEGGSRDGTYEEMERVRKQYPHKQIRLYKQKGRGKGDAVRSGFLQARGDVLMILDADLTVAPEDLPKFYQALKDNRGEFINGCRLIYQMEGEAMRFLNLAANKFFGIFFSWLLGQPFKDTLCGTKVLLRHHYEEIAQERGYFGDFDPFGDFDLIFGASKLNLKIIELPIRYHRRQYGTSQIQRFRHGLLLLRMCLFALRKIKFI